MRNPVLQKPNKSIEKGSTFGRCVRLKKNEALMAGFRILIVDDEKSVRECLSWMLNSIGFRASVAGSGFEALGMFRQEAFELVLTDLNMPGMNGWRLSRKIKEKSPATTIMMLTGEEPAGVIAKMRESCVDSVMFKPFKIAEIKRAILQIRDKARAAHF